MKFICCFFQKFLELPREMDHILVLHSKYNIKEQKRTPNPGHAVSALPEIPCMNIKGCCYDPKDFG